MWFCRKRVDDQLWEELNREVMRLTRENDLAAALAQGQELFRQSRAGYGKKHVNTVTALNNLGIIHTLRHDFEEAESFLLEALQISERVCGKISGEVAIVNKNLARLYTIKAQVINEALAVLAAGQDMD
jgi:Flp pilus assembly protein TadD